MGDDAQDWLGQVQTAGAVVIVQLREEGFG